jgi:hypothetical protein
MNIENPKDITSEQNIDIKPENGLDSMDIILQTDLMSRNESLNTVKEAVKRTAVRKCKPFQPIIMTLTFVLIWLAVPLCAQLSGSVELGTSYTDNAFQLSEYDIQRFETGNPELKFAKASDDAVLNAKLHAAYELHWRWWKIQPTVYLNAGQNILNPEKQKLDATAGLRISRRLGEFGIFYGYYPDVYLRDYIDTGGSNLLQPFAYAKNQYRADLQLKPLKKSTATLEFKREELFYNEYFTEFDGTIDTWTLGWQQSFPTFYLDAAYAYRVYETDGGRIVTAIEDASYESNVYSFGLLMKKMPVDTQYPNLLWRPELDLSYEQRYFQGSDNWHAGRTDIINNTDASLQFYFGKNWNINLDYSHIFRNVDAIDLSVQKYKEYSENRYGVSARYQF